MATLDGQGALIIGGGGGFGSAFAERLTRDGAEVTLLGRTESRLVEAAERIRDLHPDRPAPKWLVGDACSAADVWAAVQAVDSLRICVTTVGGGTVSPLMALTADTLRADFDRNVVSASLAIRYAAEAMARVEGGGAIVCTSTSAAGLSFPYMPSYSVTKAALEALVRVAADELGHLGIRVNAIRPGLVDTGGATPGLLVADPQSRANALREKPLSRVGTVDDIADGVRYLVGPESAWVTGICLPVEGGNHLRRAPDLERLARSVRGDAEVDAAKAGRVPDAALEADLN